MIEHRAQIGKVCGDRMDNHVGSYSTGTQTTSVSSVDGRVVAWWESDIECHELADLSPITVLDIDCQGVGIGKESD